MLHAAGSVCAASSVADMQTLLNKWKKPVAVVWQRSSILLPSTEPSPPRPFCGTGTTRSQIPATTSPRTVASQAQVTHMLMQPGWSAGMQVGCSAHFSAFTSRALVLAAVCRPLHPSGVEVNHERGLRCRNLHHGIAIWAQLAYLDLCGLVRSSDRF